MILHNTMLRWSFPKCARQMGQRLPSSCSIQNVWPHPAVAGVRRHRAEKGSRQTGHSRRSLRLLSMLRGKYEGVFSIGVRKLSPNLERLLSVRIGIPRGLPLATSRT